MAWLQVELMEAAPLKPRIACIPLAALITLACLLHNSPASAQDVIAAASHFTVKAVSTITYPFEQEYKGTGWGAGFLADRERGWILTNAHVAGRSPSEVEISFKGHPYEQAEKIYIDNHLDVAVLRVDPAHIPAGAVAGSLQCANEYPPGRAVIAFGHPWALDYTATRGIISGTKVTDGVESLQTDAALNNGNSGGPLIDAETGTIVGINQSSLRGHGTQGLHFAVPIRLVCTILDLLKNGKDPAPPVLPVSFAAGLEDGDLAVATVGTPWAGQFKIGDRVLAVDGDLPYRNVSRVLDRMRGKQRVTFRIERNGQEQDAAIDIPPEKDAVKRRGVHVSGMIVGPTAIPGGRPNQMIIHFIESSSEGERAELYAGDQVTAIDGLPIGSYEALLKTFESREGHPAELTVKRERLPAGSGYYDYFVRRMLVEDVFELTERGRVQAGGARPVSFR